MEHGPLINPLGESVGTPKDYTFGYLDLAMLMIREKGIHEGHWAVTMAFRTDAKNVQIQDTAEMVPGILSAVVRIGIHRYDEPTAMTVDAAEVNPRGGIN